MRILIFDTFYPAFLQAHYAAHPGLEERGYAEQWRSVMDAFFATADSHSHHLRELGHEAHEVVLNSPVLERAWAREHGSGPDAVWARIEQFRPQVVYLQNLALLSGATLRRLRESGIALVGQIATEPPRAARLRAFDLIVTAMPHFVARFRELGVRTEYLPLAFDPRIRDRLESEPEPNERYDAVFVGALNRFRRWRSNRILERAARRTPVLFWGYGARQWSPRSPVRRNYRGQAWGLDMFRVLRAARISLNRHGDVSERYANNMRLYEATGIGSLLLTDHKENLGELFELGREAVSYRDADDLVAKIGYYLVHEDERREIASAGQKRTLRDHGYPVRMRRLAELLESVA